MNPTLLDLPTAESALGLKLIANGKGSQALHDTVVAYQANRRAGTHSTKTKAEVAYSGKKPWRQKGTGNARSGYKSSPVWSGGGVVFGPKPRDYSKVTSKKVRLLALRKALSEAAKSGRLSSIKELKVSAPKTKELASLIKSWSLSDNVLILTGTPDAALLRAGRNLPKVEIVPASDVNAEQILAHKQVLIVEDAIAPLKARLK
ncbi:MAG: 50S ribosomal protein L4 [Candidatus Methylacidiphilales bacterium]